MYIDLVYKFRRIVGNQFLEQLIKIVNHYEKIGYN